MRGESVNQLAVDFCKFEITLQVLQNQTRQARLRDEKSSHGSVLSLDLLYIPQVSTLSGQQPLQQAAETSLATGGSQMRIVCTSQFFKR